MNPVHFSNLKHFSLSPMHYKASLDTRREESRAMRIGSAVHAIVLGGPYSVFDGAIRRGKAWESFKADHAGDVILNLSESEDASEIANAVLSDPIAIEVLGQATHKELPIAFDYIGRSCAGRVDFVGPGLLGDLKVTCSAEPDKFARQAIRMYYHAQLAWYRMGLNMPADTRCLIIAVEDKPPFPVTVREVTSRALEAGEKSYRLWMEQLLGCEASDSWPGYSQSITPLDISDWDDGCNLVIDGEEVEL